MKNLTDAEPAGSSGDATSAPPLDDHLALLAFLGHLHLRLRLCLQPSLALPTLANDKAIERFRNL